MQDRCRRYGPAPCTEALVRIEDLALLSDRRTAALVDRDGTVRWFSPGRFDRPSVFGSLLGPDAGHWAVSPTGGGDATREYLDDGPILATTFRTPSGVLRLTDALALAPGARAHAIAGTDSTQLVRHAEVIEGEVEVGVELVARPEYGLTVPHLSPTADGWDLVGGPTLFRLRSSVELRAEGDRLRGSAFLRRGDSAAWTLGAGNVDDRPAPVAIREAGEGWRSLAATHQAVEGPHGAAMTRSAMVLQALTYAPTGVVVAAPTTSLPERVGEGWNWDYRFAWLRDLAFVVHALWVAACPDEPVRYLDWVARALGRLDSDHVQIMFGIEGERDLTEHTLDHLPGYRDSRPVRVGNDAWRQRQSDVLGEVLDAAHLMREHLDPSVATPVRETLIGLAERAASTWREPDFGMWEARDEARHYLSGKVMCWVALDRAVKLARHLDAGERAAGWARARDDVRRVVLSEGWNDDVGSFVGALGSDRLDASVLLMPLVGIIDGRDERMVRTVRAVEERLASEHGVQRWADEGSAFVLCGFWLAECLAAAGELDRAEERFSATASAQNDLGLMAEEVSLTSGEALGNMPQALSHVGLINAAWRLSDKQRGQSTQ
jgi:GH15 family glucan-1,4-alpha-glucosidase